MAKGDLAAKVAARAIVFHEGRVLMLEAHDGSRVYYFLPGGHVRHGERLEDAARREVLEETGLRVVVDRALYVREFIAARHKRRAKSVPIEHHALAVVFLCHLAEVHGEVAELGSFQGDEGVQGVSGLRWLALSELAPLEIHPPQLKRVLTGGFPPEGEKIEFWGEE